MGRSASPQRKHVVLPIPCFCVQSRTRPPLTSPPRPSALAPQVGTRCRLVAVLLHYCFLAAFCWMSLEGVELYFLVVRVFQGQGLRKLWLCLIGYGVPLIIVGISAGAYSKGYGREKL